MTFIEYCNCLTLIAPRSQAYSDQQCSWPEVGTTELDYVDMVNLNTAFNMMLCGRKDLVPHALQMLPATKVTQNHFSPSEEVKRGLISDDQSDF